MFKKIIIFICLFKFSLLFVSADLNYPINDVEVEKINIRDYVSELEKEKIEKLQERKLWENIQERNRFNQKVVGLITDIINCKFKFILGKDKSLKNQNLQQVFFTKKINELRELHLTSFVEEDLSYDENYLKYLNDILSTNKFLDVTDTTLSNFLAVIKNMHDDNLRFY